MQISFLGYKPVRNLFTHINVLELSIWKDKESGYFASTLFVLWATETFMSLLHIPKELLS